MRELRALASATRLWESSGRDDADLYRGARLAVTSELAVDRTDSLTPDEAAFLDASARLVDAERIAAEERTRTRERQNRRLRRSLVGLGVVTILALIAGLIAVVQSNRADDQAVEAKTQAALAAQQSVDADTQHAVADEQRSAAEERPMRPRRRRRTRPSSTLRTRRFSNVEIARILPRFSRSRRTASILNGPVRRCSRRSRATSASSAIAPSTARKQWSESFRSRMARMRSVHSTAVDSFASTSPRAPSSKRSIPSDSDDGPLDERTMLRLSGDGRVAALAVQGCRRAHMAGLRRHVGPADCRAGDRSVRHGRDGSEGYRTHRAVRGRELER